MTRIEQYEQALETLGEFASEGNDNPRIIEAMGIATLRMPMLPTEAPPDRREMVLMAGRASYMMATRNTASARQGVRGARRALSGDTERALCVRRVSPAGASRDKAIDEFKRELEIQPAHPWSLMQIAFEYLKRGDAATALPWAQQAVRCGAERVPRAQGAWPGAARHRRRRRRDQGTADRDQARAGQPGLHFTLARAYQRAGRNEDAAREREEFTRLDRLARTERSGAQSVGGTLSKVLRVLQGSTRFYRVLRGSTRFCEVRSRHEVRLSGGKRVT